MKSIVALGDMHHEYQRIIDKIIRLDLRDAIIVQVGDFGVTAWIDYEKEELIELNDFLISRSLEMKCIRGNHDFPLAWKEQIYNFSNIQFIPDYTVLKIKSKKCLFVGGAISINRIQMEFKGLWWEGENFVYDEKKLRTLDLTGLDCVFTHNLPNFCYPNTYAQIVEYYISEETKFIKDADYREELIKNGKANARMYNFLKDSDLNRELTQEREDIGKLYNYLKSIKCAPLRWFAGHHHVSHTEVIDNTTFRILDVHEFLEI